MSSVRPAAPSPPPGGLPGPPPPSRRRRHHRGAAAPGPPPGSPPAGAPGSNDVFVTSRSDFRAQLRRCQRLLAPGGGPGGPGGAPGAPGGPGELRLHGLGLAVPRTINLALQLQAGAGGTLRLHASTSSVPLRAPRARRRHTGDTGDSGDTGGEDGDTPRHNSAIHIRLCREAPCA
nr:ribonuclease P protein subunit p20 [Taeniopygia guttata]